MVLLPDADATRKRKVCDDDDNNNKKDRENETARNMLAGHVRRQSSESDVV